MATSIGASAPSGEQQLPGTSGDQSSSRQLFTSATLGVSAVKRSPSPASFAANESSPVAKKKRMFSRELRYMMHGFGDDSNPYTETVDLMEDLVVDFITEMTQKAMDVGKSGKVHVNDIIFVIRKDQKKYARVKELLTMNEELKKARKFFENDAEY